MSNGAVTVNWFEIPTTDIKRSAAFYGTVLATAQTVRGISSVVISPG